MKSSCTRGLSEERHDRMMSSTSFCAWPATRARYRDSGQNGKRTSPPSKCSVGIGSTKKPLALKAGIHSEESAVSKKYAYASLRTFSFSTSASSISVLFMTEGTWQRDHRSRRSRQQSWGEASGAAVVPQPACAGGTHRDRCHASRTRGGGGRR